MAAVEQPAQQEAQVEAQVQQQQRAPAQQSFTDMKREVVVTNVTEKTRRVVILHAFTLIFSVVVMAVSSLASDETSEMCKTSPVGLKDWFFGLAMLQGFVCAAFFCILFFTLSIVDSLLQHARRGLEAAPAPALAPGPAAAAEAEPATEGAVPSATPDTEVPINPLFPEDVCCAQSLLMATVVAALLTFALLVWAIVGIASMADAMKDENDATCETGRSYFWVVFSLGFVNACCCKGMNFIDMLSRKKKSSEGQRQVEVSV